MLSRKTEYFSTVVQSMGTKEIEHLHMDAMKECWRTETE